VSAIDAPPVPQRYRGVWVRRLLATPTARDDTTVVRWLQTARWHADLRIPADARPAGDDDVGQLARQQGFFGVTTVHDDARGEVCTWHRHADLQPPAALADAGWMVFDGTERVLETGVHADYHEVWERQPGSVGRHAVVATRDDVPTTWLVAGRFAMRVRPRATAWPAGVSPGDTLAGVVARHPGTAVGLLDFEISFGALDGGWWTIAHSTLPHLEGAREPLRLQRLDATTARVETATGTLTAHVLEWDVDGAVVD
jgi:hypothetical protein